MCEWSLILFKFPEEIIVVNMDTDPGFKKMDTVVKLDSVSVICFNVNSKNLIQQHLFIIHLFSLVFWCCGEDWGKQLSFCALKFILDMSDIWKIL